jgi:ribulose-5-phosphate 4-epimerase/fuculose-1-phosphate aldolase
LESEQSSQRNAAIADLLWANKILAAKGVLDAFGHVSIRDPANIDHFIMARSDIAAKLVTRDDLVVYDLDAKPLDKPGVHSHSERYIHSEIYRLRQDVAAVVHSHSPSVIPFGLVKGVPMQAAYHMAGFLASGVPIFEIRDVDGDGTNMLVNDAKRGRGLAKALGAKPVVLMRGHGNTVAARDVRQAAFRAIYTEINARLQLQAIMIACGKDIEYLSAAEGDAFSNRGSGGGTNRAWELWKDEIEKPV